MFPQQQHRQRGVGLMGPASRYLLAASRQRLLCRKRRPSATKLWCPVGSQNTAHDLVRMFRLVLYYCIKGKWELQGHTKISIVLIFKTKLLHFQVKQAKCSTSTIQCGLVFPDSYLIHVLLPCFSSNDPCANAVLFSMKVTFVSLIHILPGYS